MQITTKLENDYLLIRITGSMDSVHEVEQYCAVLTDSTRDHDIRRVLLDETGLKDKTTPLDATLVGDTEDIIEIAMRGVRIACLVTTENAMQGKAYETALINRSLNYRMFTDRQQAVDWLMS